ncbi:MAG: hypothetical protein WC855_04860 [Thermodesulfovibrionales bacterium]
MKMLSLSACFSFFALFMLNTELYAVQTAPRISDREIVERLTRLEEGQKALDKRFDEMNKRFDMLMWMIGLFASIVSVILGFVVKMQWQMNKRLSSVEATIEVQRDEISFFKSMIEKLITPKVT